MHNFRLITHILRIVFSFCIFGSVSLSLGYAQCPEGIVHLHSDETVKAFIKAYPNCTELDSSLIIGPLPTMASTRITDISGLHKIRSIHGDLKVTSNPFLRSIQSLEGIEVVDGDYSVGGLHKEADKVFHSNLIKVGYLYYYEVGSYHGIEMHFDHLIKAKDIYVNGDKFEYDPFPNLWKIEGGINMYVYGGSESIPIFQNLEHVGRVTLALGNPKLESLFPSLKEVNHLTIEGVVKEEGYLRQISVKETLSLRAKFESPLKGLELIDSLAELTVHHWNANITESLPNLDYVDKFNVYNYTVQNTEQRFLTKVNRLHCSNAGCFELANSIDTINHWRYERANKFLPLDSLKQGLSISKLDIINCKGETFQGSCHSIIKELAISNNNELTTLAIHLESPINKLYIGSNKLLKSVSSSAFKFLPSANLNVTYNPLLEACEFIGICDAMNNGISSSFYDNHEQCDKLKLRENCN